LHPARIVDNPEAIQMGIVRIGTGTCPIIGFPGRLRLPAWSQLCRPRPRRSARRWEDFHRG